MNPTENLAAAVAALKTARKQLDEVNTGPSEGRYLAGARACRAAMLAERAVADAALAWGDWHAENKAQAEEVRLFSLAPPEPLKMHCERKPRPGEMPTLSRVALCGALLKRSRSADAVAPSNHWSLEAQAGAFGRVPCAVCAAKREDVARSIPMPDDTHAKLALLLALLDLERLDPTVCKRLFIDRTVPALRALLAERPPGLRRVWYASEADSGRQALVSWDPGRTGRPRIKTTFSDFSVTELLKNLDPKPR